MCHSKPSGHGKFAHVPQVVEPQEKTGGRFFSIVFQQEKRWVFGGSPCLEQEPMWKGFFWSGRKKPLQVPFAHWQGLTRLHKLDRLIAPIFSIIQTCLVHRVTTQAACSEPRVLHMCLNWKGR